MLWLSVFSEDKEHVPLWATPTDDTLVTVKVGMVDSLSLIDIPGANGEHILFEQNPTGRMTLEEWSEFCSDIKAKGNVDQILIIKDSKGTRIHEGNHRIRACLLNKMPVYTELRIYGGGLHD